MLSRVISIKDNFRTTSNELKPTIKSDSLKQGEFDGVISFDLPAILRKLWIPLFCAARGRDFKVARSKVVCSYWTVKSVSYICTKNIFTRYINISCSVCLLAWPPRAANFES